MLRNLFKENKTIVIYSLLFMIGVDAFSQTSHTKDSLSTGKQSEINLDLLGISFQHETSTSNSNTFLIRAGLIYDFLITGSNVVGERYRYSYSISPVLAIGGRHYYRLKRPTFPNNKNIGNFIGLDLGVKAASIQSKNFNNQPVLFLVPYWGIQRRIGKPLSFELGLGIALKYSLENQCYEDGFGISPNIQARIGWVLSKEK